MSNRNGLEHIVSGREALAVDGRPSYSSAVIAENIAYLAGITTGRDSTGAVEAQGDIEGQTIAVFEEMKRVLQSVGATFGDVIKLTVFATRREYRPTISKIRVRYLNQPPPASTFLVVSELADPEFLIEIEAIALPGGSMST